MSEALEEAKAVRVRNKGLKLSPWYLNTRRIEAATGHDIGAEAQRSINENSGERADQMRFAMRLAQGMVSSDRIPNLTRRLLQKKRPTGRVFASTWATFTFRGLTTAVLAEQAGKPRRQATLSGKLFVGEDVEAHGPLLTDHVYSSSSVRYLSGRKRAYVAGYFDFSRSGYVEISPVIIGEFISEFADGVFKWRWPKDSRVHCSEIDAFKQSSSVRAPTPKQLMRLQDISEKEVKKAFAEILGEPFVPKDWGGEKSDLYSSRVTIDGDRISTAFLLKGPALFRPMYPADLGKRGDQLVRLFDEPADLLILQHCHKVETSVIRQMEALQPNNPRMYCVIDGADTYRILRGGGYL